MAVIQDIIAALWQHDFAALADPHIVVTLSCLPHYLENGLLPASFCQATACRIHCAH